MRAQFFAMLVLASISLVPKVSHAREPAEKPKELELLQRFAGSWNADITRKFVDADSKEQRFHSAIESEPVLDGWFVKSENYSYLVDSPEQATKELVLATYDRETKRYVSWSFQSAGRITCWRGTWDPELEVLHWYSRTEPPAKPIEAKLVFSGENSIQTELSHQSKTGHPFFEKVIRTRKKAALIDLTEELWSKIEPPIKPIPPEVKTLQPLVGEWDARYTQLPSAAFPNGGEAKGRIRGKWILDGRFFLGRSRVGNYETMSVIGYDTEQQTYRYVRFDNRGDIEENAGNWNQGTGAFKWKGVNMKPGYSRRAVVYIIGRDNRQSRIISKDADGHVLLESRIRAERKK